MASTLATLNDDVLLLITEAIVALPQDKKMIEPDDKMHGRGEKRWLQRPIGNFSKVNKRLRGFCLPFILAQLDLRCSTREPTDFFLQVPQAPSTVR